MLKFLELTRPGQVAWASWALVLFLLPFNRFGGIRNAALVALFFSLLALWRTAPSER